MIRDLTPIGCATLELAAWWAEQRARGHTPSYERTLGVAGLIAWKWIWFFTPEDPRVLLDLAAQLAQVAR